MTQTQVVTLQEESFCGSEMNKQRRVHAARRVQFTRCFPLDVHIKKRSTLTSWFQCSHLSTYEILPNLVRMQKGRYIGCACPWLQSSSCSNTRHRSRLHTPSTAASQLRIEQKQHPNNRNNSQQQASCTIFRNYLPTLCTVDVRRAKELCMCAKHRSGPILRPEPAASRCRYRLYFTATCAHHTWEISFRQSQCKTPQCTKGKSETKHAGYFVFALKHGENPTKTQKP